MKRNFLTFFICVMGATYLFAQPANDDLCDATMLTVGQICTSVNGDNTAATSQTGEPFANCYGSGTNSVWFMFVPLSSGAGTITTNTNITGTLDDTSIGLYGLPGGDCTDLSGLVYLGCNDDALANRLSEFNFSGLTAGETYYIQVVGYSNRQGDFCIEVTQGISFFSLCGAISLEVGGICNSLKDNTGATSQPDEPFFVNCYGTGMNSVWFSFVAPASGVVTISTNTDNTGSLDDTSIGLYELPGGDCTDLLDLNPLVCNDDNPNNSLSEIRGEPVFPGETYYIQVVGFDNKAGEFCIEVFDTPLNDDLCDAVFLTVGEDCFEPNGETRTTTGQAGEPFPDCFGNGTHTVWYAFVAPLSGVVNISTNNRITGSLDDTSIGLYQLPGGDCTDPSTLDSLGCNDDSGSSGLAEIREAVVTPGETYYIQIGGHDDAYGSFCIEVEEFHPPGIVYVDAAATGAENGLSWTDAFTDLQDALQFSQRNDSIFVAGGTYLPDGAEREVSFLIEDSVYLFGGFAGTELSLSDRLADSDGFYTFHTTVLSGDLGIQGDFSDNSYHVVSAGRNCVLDGFFVINGFADGDDGLPVGGGVFIDGKDASISNCILGDNYAISVGGGLYIRNGTLTLSNCAFFSNGGVISAGGIYARFSTLNASNCQFENNITDSIGGAMRIVSSNTTLKQCVFYQNKSEQNGGGIMVEKGTIHISDSCLFERNIANGETGGGLLLIDCASIVEDAEFVDNYCEVDGGGIFVSDGSLSISGSIFRRNISAHGAGIFSDECELNISDSFFKENEVLDDGAATHIVAGKPVLTNCEFELNLAGKQGGGVYCFVSDPKIVNCKFTENAAESGGGIFSESSIPTIRSCEFIQNEAFRGACIYNQTSTGKIDSCLFGGNIADDDGGGIYNSGSDPDITTCEFIDNKADAFGAGIQNLISSPNISNCTFEGGLADLGGGILNDRFSNPTISECKFINNEARDGGGMMNFPNSNPIIKNCLFQENFARNGGGGIFSEGCKPSVSYCTFIGNHAEELGGGVQNADKTEASFSFCTFLNNKADIDGGGMVNFESKHSTIRNCAFIGNVADAAGGGMFNADECSPTILSSTFSGNSADYGGGIGNYDDSTLVTILGCTFYQNDANTLGGGIFNRDANTLLSNTIVADNDPGGDIAFDSNPGRITSLGHNLIGDSTGSGVIIQATDLWGSSAVALDPMLDTLADNGGPTLSHAPLAGSLVINSGEPLNVTTITRDQRGFSRIIGSKRDSIDIGAFEAQSVSVTPPDRQLCVGDNDFFPLGDILIQDSTGGAFVSGNNLSLILSLPPGVNFQPGTGTVDCAGVGLSGCGVTVANESLSITYSRTYDTLTQTIRISGLFIKVDSGFVAGEIPLFRTGGNALQYDNEVQDSISHANISILSTHKLSELPYDESFEADPAQWRTSGSTSSWQWGAPDGKTIKEAATGQNAWMTGLQDSYPASDTSWVASPCFDFRGVSNPLVALSIWSDNEEGFDGAILQQSIDAGDSWQVVGNNQRGIEWYNTAFLIANPGNQNTVGHFAWTGRDADWRRARLKLENLGDEEAVRFRVAFASISNVDTTTSNDGFAFDDFFIGESTKKALLEHFTNQSEINNNNRITSLSEANSQDVIPIQFHITEGDDFYEKSPAGPRTRGLYYGISEPGIAAVEGRSFLGAVDDLTQEILEKQILSESGMEIAIDTTQNNISISSLRDIDDEILVFVAVVENTPDYKNVFRKFLPNPGGTSFFGWQQGVTETISVSWGTDAIPSPSIVDNYDSLHVIVWAQNQETKEVYQTATSPIWTGLLDPSVLRKGQFTPVEAQLSVYPNPVRRQLFLSFGKEAETDFEIHLTDMQGRAILSRNMNAGEAVYAFDLNQLSGGVYTLQVKAGGEILLREKVIVVGE